MKRIIILIAGVVVLGGIVLGIFYFLKPKEQQEKTSPAGPGEETVVTPTEGSTSTLRLVSDQPVREFFVNERGETILLAPGGQIAELRGNQINVLASTSIPNILDAAFSSTGKKLAVQFGNRETPQLSVFNLTTKTWQPWTQPVTSFAWAPEGERIAYLTTTGGRSPLEILDLGTEKAKLQSIFSLQEQDLEIAWGTSSTIHLFDKGSVRSNSSWWEISLPTKSLRPIVEERNGFSQIWDSKRNRGLLFVSNQSGRGGQLQLVDARGTILRNLNFLTLPAKCAFGEQVLGKTSPTTKATTTSNTTSSLSVSSSFLVCAVPRDRSEFSKSELPDAYYKKSLFTVDDFYRIDLETGDTRALLTNPATAVDGTHLRATQKQLFFLNRFDQKLYSLPL